MRSSTDQEKSKKKRSHENRGLFYCLPRNKQLNDFYVPVSVI